MIGVYYLLIGVFSIIIGIVALTHHHGIQSILRASILALLVGVVAYFQIP